LEIGKSEISQFKSGSWKQELPIPNQKLGKQKAGIINQMPAGWKSEARN
jgi:hypothetical protein